ncbi:MAG: MiaB/RimO family radical SAM methylthiotransferase [Kiritimatiellae bacterium]|nr:MiaB/RimO family radical SAM methylthiotransferase [Kiritimatiellia bacterium]
MSNVSIDVAPGPGFRYNLWTTGCQMNEADAARVAALLEAAGGRSVDDAREADLVLLNTCAVRQQAEDKAHVRLRYVGQLRRRNPRLVVALMGCMVGTNPERMAALREAYPFIDLFLPPSDLRPLREFLATREAAPTGDGVGCVGGGETDDGRPPVPAPDGIRAYLPAVLGCSHACAYCVIPYRRGAERSRPSGELLDEAQELVRRGARELTVLGQIIDRYGLDRPGEMHLPELLRRLAEIPGLLRLRFLTSHPNWFTDELLDAMADTPVLCPYVELPVQAGSDAILAAMRRGYTAEQYRALIRKIRGRIPGVGLSTDIIVGFPGETEADFEATMSLMREVRPDMIRVAKYSPRPQTLSARTMSDDVPAEVKEARRVALEGLLRDFLTEKHADYPGRTVEILVESVEPGGRRRGRTPDAKLVFVDGCDAPPGTLLPVTITWAGPFSLIGEPG